MRHPTDFQTNKAWYLAQLKPNSHRIAEINLDRQGFKSFCPLMIQTKRQKGKFIKVEKPLFPGYIFVKHDPDQGPLTPINYTRGVARLVAFDAKGPLPMPMDLMDNIFRRFGPNTINDVGELKQGQIVQIIDGPFVDFFAQVESMDTKDRIWLLLDFLGQKTRVQSTRQQVIV